MHLEIIDYKILATTRYENKKLGTVDFVHRDGSIVFRTSPEEKGKVILQLGTADASRALLAAQKVQNDVAAVDVNMGCPKAYSIKGGMGAALLRQPEKVKSILTTLVQNLRIPVTCKIRILNSVDDTLSLVRLIESTGVAAIAVHGRRKEDRPNHPNQDEVIRAVAGAIKVPVLANGGSKTTIRLHEDIEFFRQTTGAAGVMVGRAAMSNPAIFAPPPPHAPPPSDTQLVREYLQLAVKYDHHVSGTKYCIQRMFDDETTSKEYVDTLSAETMAEICEIWGLPADVVEMARQQCCDTRGVVPHRPHTDDDDAAGTDAPPPPPKTPRMSAEAGAAEDGVVALPIGFVRHEWPAVGDTPKQLLLEHCKHHRLSPPSYSTTEVRASRSFYAVVTVDGVKYSHTVGSKTKRFAEQAAALACLTHLKLWPAPKADEKCKL